MILYYVRHGDPIYDPDSLTPIGHRQAEALSKRFKLYGLDEIYCSTSTRAQMTAEPTCKILNKEKILLDWTNEKYAWEDASMTNEKGEIRWCYYCQEVREKFNSVEIRNLGTKWYTHPFFKGTVLENGTKRIDEETDKFMLSLGYKHDREKGSYNILRKNSDRVALFAHEGFGKLFLSSLLDIPYPTIATKFDLGHSSVTVIFFGDDGESTYPRVLQWSNDSHLYKEDVLTGYHNWLDI